MKKLFFYLVASLMTAGVNAQTSAPVDGEIEALAGAKISFEKETHDYGEVKYGGDGYCTFEFTNTGSQPLIISHAQGSCGCTVPDWPKTPIAPGESGTIKVKYNTEKPGSINKSVTISSNALNTPTKVVRIKGNVLPKKDVGAPINSSGAPVK